MRVLLLVGAMAVSACGGHEASVELQAPKLAKLPQESGLSTEMTRDAADAEPTIVEFHIPADTGRGAWNTRETMVAVQVGNVLRIVNDDSINHRLHTNGRPCDHGPTIAPGASFDCVVSRTLNPDTDGALYDHNVGPSAAFWVAATEPDEAVVGDVLYERDAIAAPITDNQTTTHDFSVPVSGLIDTLSVHLRLTHTYIGDLLIKLRAPNGVEVTLHNRTGGSTANINILYGDGGAVPIAGIEQLFGADVRGAWRLTVADQAGSDIGTLDYLKVTVARSFR